MPRDFANAELKKPPSKPLPFWAAYPVALVSIAIALLIRWFLDPLLGDQLPLLTLYGGVAVAVCFSGWGPALFAAAAGYVAAQYLFVVPRHELDFQSPLVWASLGGYILSCGLIIYLGEAMRRAGQSAEEQSQRLKKETSDRKAAEEALAEGARRQEVLHKFVERRHRAESLTEIYESGLDTILEVFPCKRASILLLDDAGVMRFVAWRGLSDAYRKAVEGHSLWKVDDPEPQPVWIKDVNRAELENSLKSVMRNEDIRALAFIPLIAEGKLIGKFMIYCDEPRDFSKEEIDLSLSVARQLALGIERKRAEEKLREGEERLRLATQTGKVGIWGWDIVANRVTWSESIYSIHGITREQFNPTVEGFAELVHPDDRELVSNAIERSLKEDAPYELNFRAVKPDGEVIWVFTNAVVVRSDGKPVRMIGATTDITDLKLVEEKLSRAKGQAEEANRAKDRFIAMLSHELRTPLTPVLMTAAALESDRTIATDLREQLRMIRRNIELEARLIDDLLDVSRITHGKFDLLEEIVDVHAAIEHALQISAPDWEAKKLNVTKTFEAREHRCRGDAARLQEVFWNILRNAVKFTPEGGTIDIVTKNDDDHSVVIEFHDSGIGIEPEVQPRIFDAFEQGNPKTRSHYGGLGLGLAISKRIIDLHEGKIEAHSPGQGQGATFRVTLKTVEGPVLEPETDVASGTADAKALPRILIVEDHRDTADVLRRILANCGYGVTACGGVDPALAAAAQGKFDLVISDIALPDGSGLELMRHLSETQGLAGIALSGFGTQEDLAASKAAGFAAHLTKPFDLQRLLEAIRELVGNKMPHPEATAGESTE